MITDKIIEEFFDAIDEVELEDVISLLEQYPELIKSSYEGLMPYQKAKNTFIYYENDLDLHPGSNASQELKSTSEQIKALIHEKTVLFAIDRQDIELLDHAKKNGASPNGTFINGMGAYRYAIQNRKTLVVDWFAKEINEAKERYKGHTELSDLLDRKAITENARDEAIISQASTTMSRLTVSS